MSDNRPTNQSAAEASRTLKEGNRRYVHGGMARPNADPSRRDDLVTGQHPFATVLTCADSRVPPELIFDQGLGDLFVIRVAGNVSDDAVLGSIEYASLHLGVNLIVVMGHKSCGAVDAAVQNKDFDGPATHSHIDALIDAIRPAVLRCARKGDDDLLERSVRENAAMVSQKIRNSKPVLSGLKEQGVVVQAAYYDLASGKVYWLSE